MGFKHEKLVLDVLKGLHTNGECELSRAHPALQDALSFESSHIHMANDLSLLKNMLRNCQKLVYIKMSQLLDCNKEFGMKRGMSSHLF